MNRRRLTLAGLVLTLVLALVVLGLGLAATLRAARVNAGLGALSAGRDFAVAPDDPPRLVEARAAWLLARDRIEEAEALGPIIAGFQDPAASAVYHFNRGNARMRRAFDLLDTQRLDDATPQIGLAKAAYRAALASAPDFFDAKVNLDLAMRLVRDLPKEEQEGEETDTPPKALWTDLPGVPGGEP